MKYRAILLISALVLLSMPLIEAKKRKKPAPMKERQEEFRPDQVKKSLRIKALQEEIGHAEKSITDLKARLGELKKGSDEYTVLKLRHTLKEDYLRGMQELLSFEKGEKKMPEMMEEEEEEFMEYD